MRFSLSRSAVVAATLMLFAGMLLAGPVTATEMGGGAYPNGAEDFMAGAVPPPGFHFVNYLTHYHADKMKMGGFPIPNFELKATTNVFRFIYISKTKILGGLWGAHVFLPVVDLDVSIGPWSQSKSGIGDIIADPFILSWHSKNWHVVTGLDIYLPTGKYNRNDFANIGRNYWTFEPLVGFSYISDGGFDVSAKLMYDINTKNDDIDYQSGQEFHVDYSIGQKAGNFTIGAGGYYYKQVTGDKLQGVKVADGLKGRVFAIGPQLKYDYKNISLILKYQNEMSVKNRPDGEKFWFKFLYSF